MCNYWYYRYNSINITIVCLYQVPGTRYTLYQYSSIILDLLYTGTTGTWYLPWFYKLVYSGIRVCVSQLIAGLGSKMALFSTRLLVPGIYFIIYK
jgi:hypothetical protein